MLQMARSGIFDPMRDSLSEWSRYLAQVDQAAGLGAGRDVRRGKAEHVPLLQNEPAAAPCLDVVPLQQQEIVKTG